MTGASHVAGTGPEDIQGLRERFAGPEAATRLAALDRRRAEWSARVEAFRGERSRIAGDGALTAAERAAATERLLAESFTPTERLRVEALDRVAATEAPEP